MKSPKWKNWHQYLLLGLLGLCFLNFLHYVLLITLYPYEWDPAEADHVYQSWRFIHGEPIYKNISDYPMIVANHPPVFFSLCGALMKVGGLNFWPGRLISILSSFSIGWLIYLAIRSDKQSPLWAAGGALLFFASPPYVSYFLPMVRVDMLMLALSLAALYFTSRATTSTLSGFLAVIFYLLAIYTKQTAIFTACAGLIWLFTVERRRALIMGSALIASGICIFLLFNQISNGEFYHQLIELNVGEREPGLMFRLAGFFFYPWGIFFIGATVGLIAIIRRRENTIWIYFFISSLINIALSARHGAALNYYLPIVASTVIICGREIGRFDNLIATVKHPLKFRIGLATVGVAGLIMLNLGQYSRPTRNNLQIMNVHLKDLGNVSGDILLSRMHSLAFLNDKTVFIFPISLATALDSDYQGVDQSGLLADIGSKRFDCILDTFPSTFFSVQIVDAIRKHYDPMGKIALPCFYGKEELMVWKPKK